MTGLPPTDLTGSILAGRYRILRKLGEGAMGAVYLGEHLKIGRQDAIKVLRDNLSGDPEAIARFNRGARNVAAIRHPNICTIYDYSDTGDGTQFLAMQFIPGESLKDLLDRVGRLPLERALSIARQTADALQAAHDAGIVHRDLKPANIMISAGRDGEDVVTVVDFDIAKGSDEGEESDVTRLGFVVGTPEYMSPEQLTGDRLDGRSDLYSLALVLFRMLTGGLPFAASSAQELMIKRLTEDPLNLDQVLPGADFPANVQMAITCALARKPEDRQADTATFANELLGRPTGRDSDAGGVPGAARQASAMGDIPRTMVARPLAADGAPQAAAASGSGRALEPATGNAVRRFAVAGGAVAAVAIGAFAVFALRGPQTGGIEDVAMDPPSRAPTADDVASGLVQPRGELAQAGTTTLLPEQAGPENGRTPPNGAPAGTVAQPSPDRTPTNAETRIPTSDAASTSPGPAPTPVPPPDAGSSDILIPLADVNATLWRQFEMLGPPEPTVATLQSIRDTADAAWRMTAVPAEDRAMAAYVAGSAWFALGNAGECVSWLRRALELRPDGPGYATMLDNCRREVS